MLRVGCAPCDLRTDLGRASDTGTDLYSVFNVVQALRGGRVKLILAAALLAWTWPAAAEPPLTKESVADTVGFMAAYDNRCERLPQKTVRMLDTFLKLADERDVKIAILNTYAVIDKDKERWCAIANR
jgi:hypothetical protein